MLRLFGSPDFRSHELCTPAHGVLAAAALDLVPGRRMSRSALGARIWEGAPSAKPMSI